MYILSKKSQRGGEYEVPITLACYGMRRSEICALTPDDLDGDIVHISKAKVMNERPLSLGQLRTNSGQKMTEFLISEWKTAHYIQRPK